MLENKSGINRNILYSSVSRTAVALATTLLVNSAVYGQNQSSETVETFDEIVVTGIRASVMRSLGQKRNEVNVSDSITAEDIGKFPDLNLSESLQRIPGVTLDRSAVGDGQSINLRGLGSQFTRVVINGMTGTSNGTSGRFGNSGGGRGFNFEILASELFSNAKVFKSVNAAQEEGGLAGVVELETPKPLDYDDLKISASGMGNYSKIADKIDPRGALLISKNFDDKFGIAASLAYSDTRYRSDTTEGGVFRPFAAANTRTPGTNEERAALNPNGTRYYYFRDDRETLGATLALQFRPSDELEITVDGLYGKLNSTRIATRDDMPIEGGVNAPLSSSIQDGVITAGQFTSVQQRVGTNYYTTKENLSQLVVRADWTPNDSWKISPFVGYAKRKADRVHDLYSFRLAENGEFDPGIVSYQINGDFVDFSSNKTDFMSNPEDFLFNVFILRPSLDEDSEFNSKLDFERYIDDEGLTSIQFGARYAIRDKNRVLTQERLQRTAGTDITVPPTLASVSELLENFNVSGSGNNVPTALLSANPDLIRDVYYPGGNAVEGTFIRPLPGFGAQQSYQIEEKTFNAYVQANFEVGSAFFNVGLRLVKTNQTAGGFTVENIFQPTERITPISISNSYANYLPSANFRYELNDDVILRAAYSKTLTRPNLSDLAPSETVAGIDEGGGTGRRGNPNLQPFTSDNFDAGIEWYFADEGLISASVFYKDLAGFIDSQTFSEERSFPRQADGVIVTAPILFTQPVNGVSASITGIEFSAQSRFLFLPEGSLQNFGAIFNYTYADSSADFANLNDVRRDGLPGLSKNSFNASIYYDDGNFDARMSYSWRDRYLAQFSDDFGVPRFVNSFGQLDFSGSYRFHENLTAQLQILNITNEQFVNQATTRFLPYGVSELDRRVLFGLRYNY